jgi:hypothetical protein
MVRTSKQQKGSGVSVSVSDEVHAESEIEASSTSRSEANRERVMDEEEYEPLYPPILRSSSSMFPSVPPLRFADMSFDPKTAKHDIDEGEQLSSADQDFISHIENLLHANRS